MLSFSKYTFLDCVIIGWLFSSIWRILVGKIVIFILICIGIDDCIGITITTVSICVIIGISIGSNSTRSSNRLLRRHISIDIGIADHSFQFPIIFQDIIIKIFSLWDKILDIQCPLVCLFIGSFWFCIILLIFICICVWDCGCSCGCGCSCS